MTKENGVEGVFIGKINPVEGLSGLKISDFVQRPQEETPGDVAVCLSGGGSRALTAGMGQLRGLKKLTLNGKSLLDQTKAVSTVSGGSWLGVTFEYLNNNNVSDDNYLCTYTTPGDLTPENVKVLPEKAIGYRVTRHFAIFDLLVEAIWIAIFDKVPTHMLWQTLMGIHIMEYYGLFTTADDHKPDSLFTFDQTTLSQIASLNPDLKNETAHLISNGAGRIQRPFQVCNMGMFVNTPGTQYQYLVPVQATPFFTGIVSQPSGVTDFNGRAPGGGGTTSFSFNSDLEKVEGNDVQVRQDRQWALVDIVGTSSAAFAETLQNLGKNYLDDPMALLKDSDGQSKHSLQCLENVKPFIQKKKPGLFENILEKIDKLSIVKDLENGLEKIEKLFEDEGMKLEDEVAGALNDIVKCMNPLYKYWPVKDIAPEPEVIPTNFADGGSLENMGVNAMLAYSDVRRLITFINCETPMTTGEYGVYDVDGNPVDGTKIQLDSQVPPLFGYQPYNDDNSKGTGGYRTYKDENGNFRPDLIAPEFRNSQVFSCDVFPALLKGLWEANGSGQETGGANFKQTLTTMDNQWFGVAGNRNVTILWVYNNYIGDWAEKLGSGVQEILKDISHFPNYKTMNTQLTETEVNLLSNMTAWNVAEGSKQLFLDMFSEDES